MNFRERVFGFGRYFSALLLGAMAAHSQATEIYFSEYAEGTPYYDRYLEVYNGSDSSIDLNDYVLAYCLNECTTDGIWESVQVFSNNTFFPTATRTIASGGVYVIRDNNGSVSATIKNAADGKNPNMKISGNDPVALLRKETGFTQAKVKAGDTSVYTVMDTIGDPVNPATTSTVCGTSNGLTDHVLSLIHI